MRFLMAQRKQRTKGNHASKRLRPKRKPSDELTIAKRYTSIPASAVEEIQRAAKIYGSQGRALQVATEILIRMKKRPLAAVDTGSGMASHTYKLVPRTVELIDELANTVYEGRYQVFAACIEALRIIDF
jgi:hypothetical protein